MQASAHLPKLKKVLLAVYFLLFTFFGSCTIPIVNREINLPKIHLPSWVPFLGGKGETGPITLTYWGLWEQPQNLQSLFDEYQRQNPDVTIEYEMRDARDHFSTVRSRLTTELTPDIIRVHNTWVPFLLESLNPVPKDIFDATTYEQTFYPVTKDTLLAGGKYYGIPLEIDGLALIYNKDLFTEAGITSPPQTWDVFRENVRKLTKKDAQNNVIQAGVAMGYAKNIDHFSDILGLMFAQNGVSFVDSDGAVNFHKSLSADGRNLGAEALAFYTLFGISEKSWNPTWEDSTLAFADGKVAMILVPSFRILDILGKSPKINLGVAKAPQLPSADPTRQSGINWGSFWVEVVPKNSPHPKEAWKFLKFLTEKESLTEFYKTCSQVRPFGEPYSRTDLASTLVNDKYTNIFVSQGQSYTSWYFADATFDKVLNDAIVKILEDMVEGVVAGKSAEGALAEAAPKVQVVLDGLKGK